MRYMSNSKKKQKTKNSSPGKGKNRVGAGSARENHGAAVFLFPFISGSLVNLLTPPVRGALTIIGRGGRARLFQH